MRTFRAFVCCLLFVCGLSSELAAQNAPGGFVEPSGTAASRPRWSTAFLNSFLPTTRSAFTFPAPYNTRAYRLTIPSDCGGADCVRAIGYSYWRQMTSNAGLDTINIAVSLGSVGGNRLFRFTKSTETITNVGPLFPAGDSHNFSVGLEGPYFSQIRPNMFYFHEDTRLRRYALDTQTFATVMNIVNRVPGCTSSSCPYLVWQPHSSLDDTVHMASVVPTSNVGAPIGCVVFKEPTNEYLWFPSEGTGAAGIDECNLTKNGQWLIAVVDQRPNTDPCCDDNIFWNLNNSPPTKYYDDDAMGHLDTGWNYALGNDPFANYINGITIYDFSTGAPTKPLNVWTNYSWNEITRISHVSHTNAVSTSTVPRNNQFACGSTVTSSSRQDEVLCFPLTGQMQQLVVAPIMTDPNASGCGADPYFRQPKGHLDDSGGYFLWSTNMGGSRCELFLVRVPYEKLVSTPPPPVDTTPPQPPTGIRVQ